MTKATFKGKRVVIFGLGSYKYGSGISAAKFFIRAGAKVLITDKKKESDLRVALDELHDFGKKYKNYPVFVLGQHRARDFKAADIIIRNPGVSRDHKLLRLARQYGAKIHTDVSLFLLLLNANRQTLNVKIIGVTGTRGKSTTTALIAEILKKSGKKIFLGGNLGYSPLNFMDEIDRRIREQKNEKTYVVLELSSWLVESLDEWKISPDCAVITNIYPDHLNTYKTMKDYIKAKAVIFKYQKPTDTLILNKANLITRRLAKQAKSKVVWFRSTRSVEASTLRVARLAGRHNIENIAAALTVAKALHINKKQSWAAVRKFKGLWGRLQMVRKWHGVKFYNDTGATTPEATLQALYTLAKLPNSKFKIQNPKTKRIILIAGGMDKNLNYSKLAQEIPKYAKALILFKGTASNKIISNFKFQISNLENFKFYSNIGSMTKAISLAWESTGWGDVILLSPAAASFNMFRNEVDRGEQFVIEAERITM